MSSKDEIIEIIDEVVDELYEGMGVNYFSLVDEKCCSINLDELNKASSDLFGVFFYVENVHGATYTVLSSNALDEDDINVGVSLDIIRHHLRMGDLKSLAEADGWCLMLGIKLIESNDPDVWELVWINQEDVEDES